jgi:hypothetical protein
MNEINSRRRGWLPESLRKVLAAGTARSVVLTRDGKVVAQLPLTTSLAGLVPAALFAPQLLASAAIVALLAKCSVEVVRTADRP